VNSSIVWSSTTGDSGPHLVLVHGSLDRSAGLVKLARRLRHFTTVTRYDRRGYGRSRPSSGPFGMDEQVADLVALLDAVESPRPVVIVGHSYGGNVALALADRHPGLVAGVVTYESPLSWMDWWPNGSSGAAAVAWRHDPEEAAERFMRSLIGDDRWERLPRSTRLARRAEGPAMVGELIDLRARAPWDSERIAAPVLAVHGEHGAPHHARAMDFLAEHLADAEVAMIGGARHFGPNTHPDEMADLISRFLEAPASDER